MKKFSSLLGFILLTQFVGGSSGLVTARSIQDGWYDGLDKPNWTPPKGVFGPVWTVLFVLIGAAAWRVWRKREDKSSGEDERNALKLWGVQLGLNAAWSLVFFGLRKPRWAFAEIVLLWTSIVLTMRSLWKLDRTAGALFVPYFLWTSFAAVLNLAIARRNAD